MVADNLSGPFAVETRDQIRDRYLADYRLRVPSADTSANTQPFVDASCSADMAAPLYFDAQKAANNVSLLTATGSGLDDWGLRLGGGALPRHGVSLSTGFVSIKTVTGGANIFAGTELKHVASGQKFTVAFTAIYTSATPVGIISEAGGPTANLPGGTALQFVTPPVGVSAGAIVIANANGDGLVGGAPAENDDNYKARLLEQSQNPPAAGNEAAVINVLENIPGLAVQKAFCWPALFGPGSTCGAILVPPSSLGASRLPNAVQVAQAEAALVDAFPGDDGYTLALGSEQLFRTVIQVTWKAASVGWKDITPWPTLITHEYVVTNAVAISASGFRVQSSDASQPIPVAGQSIGLWDPVARVFRRKLILTATVAAGAGTLYDLVFDMVTLNASDPNFAPANGAIVSPWSDSLNLTVPPLLAYVDGQGPGEMVASFGDPGLRQKRFPTPTPDIFPNKIENRMVDGLFAVVEDAKIVEPTIPLTTTIGTPGVLFYIHRISDMGVFPE